MRNLHWQRLKVMQELGSLLQLGYFQKLMKKNSRQICLKRYNK